MTCSHLWHPLKPLSERTSRIKCVYCEKTAIGKPSTWLPLCLPYVSNALIVQNLLTLICSKGIDCDIPKAELAQGRWMNGSSAWMHPSLVIDDWGDSGRVSIDLDVKNAKWPAWLYWFDVWIGRSDAAGDNNLLFFPDRNIVVPVDFELAFPWTYGYALIHAKRVDDLKCEAHPKIKTIRDEKVRDVIKGLSDEEIWTAVRSVDTPYWVAIWSGLSLRRDLL